MRCGIGVLVCLSLMWPAAAVGQTVGATTGAINGKVVDSSDAVLPGVTVTISAPQMQGDADGGDQRGRQLSLSRYSAGHLSRELRAARVRDRWSAKAFASRSASPPR